MSATERTDKKNYLVYTTTEEGRCSAGPVYLWWGPNRSGYTILIENAGRYTLDEAKSIMRMRGAEGAMPVELALKSASHVVKIDRLQKKLDPMLHEDGIDGLIAPQKALEWLLNRVGSWTSARFDQHARNEFGDEATDRLLSWLHERGVKCAAEAKLEADRKRFRDQTLHEHGLGHHASRSEP